MKRWKQARSPLLLAVILMVMFTLIAGQQWLTTSVLASSAVAAAAPAAPDQAAVAQAIPKRAPHVVTADVRALPHVPSAPKIERESEMWQRPKVSADKSVPDPAKLPGPLAAMPGPLQNFAGLSYADLCGGVQCGAGFPPDTNGDVGPNHYIEAVNDAFAIYNKTGTLLASFTENSLWSGAGTGTPCDANNEGDPVVVYDGLADRWILTNLGTAVSGGNPVAPF